MTRRNRITLVGAVAVAFVGWYFFRPERALLTDSVSESAPAGESIAILTGQFSDRAHEGSGKAEVIQLADGRRVLRFSDFATLNGPDLQVYLLGAPDVSNRSGLEAAGYLSLGALKGNVGDQNYEIPVDTDLSRYRAVSVWCRRFGVNFTTAPLAAPGAGT